MRKCIIFFITCLLVWCHSAQSKEKTIIRVGYVPLVNQLPLIVAHENAHSFKFDFNLIKYASYTSLEAAMRVGAIDAASIPVTKVLSIHADGIPIKIVGTIHRGGSTLVSRKKGGLDVLASALVGVPGLDSCENLEIKKLLSEKNLRFGIDYKTIGIPFHTAIQYLKGGKLDALFLPEPFGYMAEKQGIAGSIDISQGLTAKKIFTGLVIQSRLLDENADESLQFMKSIIEACRFIETDIRLSEGRQTAIIQTHYFGYPEDMIADLLVRRRGAIRFDQFFPDPKQLHETMRLASEMKLIMKSVDLDTIYSIAPMRDAMMQ
jgi:ABC-type nitrate/sulfonate/bicarbonate transport system substrate-binding protein